MTELVASDHLTTDVEATPRSGSTLVLHPEVGSMGTLAASEWHPRAVLSTLGASLALFCTYGQMNAFGTFQTYYSTHQLYGLPPTTISWIGSMQLFVLFICGIPAGMAFDKYGPLPLLVIGSVIHVLSIIMTSFATRYFELMLTHGVLFGLGVALIFYPCLATVSTHFKRHRSTALGIVMVGSGIGGVVYPIMLQHTFARLGFGWSERLCAGISLLLCSIACLTVSSQLHQVDGNETKSRLAVPGKMLDAAVFTDGSYLLLIASSFLISLGLFIPYFFITSYTRSLAQPPSLALSFYTLSVMNGGGILGRLCPPLLADSLGPYNLILPSTLFMGVSTLTLWLLSEDMTMVLVYAAVYGFFSGSFISLINPCVVKISERETVGRKIGGLYSIIALPALVGNPIGAMFQEKSHGSYRNMIIFSGTAILLGSALVALTRWRLAGWRLLAII